ncbi:MAG: sulfatase [Opitutaceae bacterium]
MMPFVSAQSLPGKFNVLFIVSDDLRGRVNHEGQPTAKTPNLDKLAASGVRFERAYCQYPVCWASRASLLMGRYPTTPGMIDHGGEFRAELKAVVTLPQLFQQNGYATARGGKIFHQGEDGAQAWDQVVTGPHVPESPGNGRRASDRWEAVAGEGEDLVDYQTASRAIRYLEQHRGDKPFFLGVGFLKPHGPFVAPKKYFRDYDPTSIKLPADFAPVPTLLPGAPAEAKPSNHEIFSQREATEQEAREMIAAYFAATSFMDAQVGRVLETLGRLKLRDRTIVVFFGDHGFQLGEKGIWSKHGSLYDVNLHIPLIIAAPSAAGNGRSCVRTVELVDLYPTLAELCGLPPPSGLDGQSLAPLLQDPVAPWQHAAFALVKRGGFGNPGLIVGRSVRTERWRYTEWNGGIEIGDGRKAELYDHDADPHERRNVYSDPLNAGTVRTLRELLRTNALKLLQVRRSDERKD